jgi:hypothetical protein
MKWGIPAHNSTILYVAPLKLSTRNAAPRTAVEEGPEVPSENRFYARLTEPRELGPDTVFRVFPRRTVTVEKASCLVSGETDPGVLDTQLRVDRTRTLTAQTPDQAVVGAARNGLRPLARVFVDQRETVFGAQQHAVGGDRLGRARRLADRTVFTLGKKSWPFYLHVPGHR